FPQGTSEPVTLTENGTYYVRVRGSMNQQVETGPVSQWSDTVSFNITPPIIEVPGLPWTMAFDPNSTTKIIDLGPTGIFKVGDAIKIQTTNGAAIRVFNWHGEQVYQGNPGTLPSLPVGHYFVETNGDRNQFMVLPKDYSGASFLGSYIDGIPASLVNQRSTLMQTAWTRTGASMWGYVETQPGVYSNWGPMDAEVANQQGRKIIAVVGGTIPEWAKSMTLQEQVTRFAAYVKAVAARYQGQLEAIELWNEPSGAVFNDNSATWLNKLYEFIAAGSDAIKAVDPNVKVVGPAWMNPISYGETKYLADLGLASKVDAFAWHDYFMGDTAPDKAVPQIGNSAPRPTITDRVAAFREAIGNSTIPIYVDELGLIADSPMGSDYPNAKIEWDLAVERSIKYLVMYRAAGVEMIMPHTMSGQVPSNTYHEAQLSGWEFNNRGPQPKVSAALMTAYWLNEATLVKEQVINDEVFLYEWRRPDGSHITFAWTIEGTSQAFQGSYSGKITDIYETDVTANGLSEEPVLFHNATADQIALLVDPSLFTSSQPVVNPIPDSQTGEVNVQFTPLTGAVIYQVQVSRNADFTDIIHEGFPQGTSEPVTLTENGTYYVRVRGSMNQQVETGPVSQWSD
ncbi:MAG: hypothetical protein HY447_03310, partial [Candidatus Omnitrophica bacterium]|nr:hypothetical protein [Candidatus Omnitrophota bacterium]